MNNLAHLRAIREYEIGRIAELLPASGRVLEIGAGSGWQAQALASRSYDVIAVDVADSTYRAATVYPVLVYDGTRLPFAAGAFDVVFSSNTLEHVCDLPALLEDTRRVLRPSGVAVHAVPTSTWRLWTNITHYAWYAQRVVAALGLPTFSHHRAVDAEPIGNRNDATARATMTTAAILLRAAVPPRHGEIGNCWTELYRFSRHRWWRTFAAAGFAVEAALPAGLFYTGYSVLDDRLNMEWRRTLGGILGSSCMIYLLRPRSVD